MIIIVSKFLTLIDKSGGCFVHIHKGGGGGDPNILDTQWCKKSHY